MAGGAERRGAGREGVRVGWGSGQGGLGGVEPVPRGGGCRRRIHPPTPPWSLWACVTASSAQGSSPASPPSPPPLPTPLPPLLLSLPRKPAPAPPHPQVLLVLRRCRGRWCRWAPALLPPACNCGPPPTPPHPPHPYPQVLLVMEYAEAGALVQPGQVTPERHMPEPMAQYYFRQIAAGLAYLHENRVVSVLCLCVLLLPGGGGGGTWGWPTTMTTGW